MAVYQGIDAGTTGIRKIIISGGWGDFKSTPNAKPLKKIMTLPSNFLTFRQFKFPFQDKKRIREVLPGELMDGLLFPIDEVLWDIPSIYKDRANTIIVPKRYIREFAPYGDEQPQALDAEPCALMRAAEYDDVENALIIDFGAAKTTFIGMKSGRMDLLRVRMAGGKNLDTLIAEKMDIPVEQAEEIKAAEGMENKTVRAFMEELISSATLPNPLNYDLVMITGGGSLTPGIQDFLAEKINVPVRFFKLPDDLSPHFDTVAFGAALHYTAGHEKVNFAENKDDVQGKPYMKIALLIIPLLLYCINLKFAESQYVRENKQILRSMSETVKKEIPQIGGATSSVAMMSQATQIVNDLKSGNTGSGMSVMDILSNISKAKKSMKVSIYDIDIADSDVKIRGEADTFQTVEDFENSLKVVFSKVDTPDQKKKPDDKIDFSMKFSAKQDQSQEAGQDESKR